ncbi:MAG TPA: hypothetical protein VGO41_05900 [Steroidobacteraceae bacterium]|jgi:hypothetical protein|nr:hypothetical protein [Steroidobacteraceae bacterium]
MTESTPPKRAQDGPEPAGRVRHETGGRAVWEWAAATGRHALESTSRLLKRLDMPGLSIEGEDSERSDAKTPRPGDAPQLPPPGQRGFNPYDRKLPARGATSAPRAPAPPAGKRPATPAPKPGLLGRLFGRKR